MDKQTFLWFLEQDEVEKIFSLVQIAEIQATVLSQLHFKKECLCLKSCYKNKTVFLKKGKVEIIKQTVHNGEKQALTIGILHTGSMWSFNDFHDKKETKKREITYIVKVIKDSELILIDDLKDLFIKEETHLSYLKIMAIQRMRIEKRVENYTHLDARARVIEHILALLKKRGQQKYGYIELNPFFTHKELGSITSTTRQLVTTVLNSLRQKQILTFERNRIRVKDVEVLEQEIKNEKKHILKIQNMI